MSKEQPLPFVGHLLLLNAMSIDSLLCTEPTTCCERRENRHPWLTCGVISAICFLDKLSSYSMISFSSTLKVIPFSLCLYLGLRQSSSLETVQKRNCHAIFSSSRWLYRADSYPLQRTYGEPTCHTFYKCKISERDFLTAVCNISHRLRNATCHSLQVLLQTFLFWGSSSNSKIWQLVDMVFDNVSITCAVVIFRVKVSCLTSVSDILLWFFAWLFS